MSQNTLKMVMHDKEIRRPQKKLSFKEPEAEIKVMHKYQDRLAFTTEKKKEIPQRYPCIGWKSDARRLSASLEDLSLENQAMKIVRTVGQAFEVCHKMNLSQVNTPDSEENIPRENKKDQTEKTSNGTISRSQSSESQCKSILMTNNRQPIAERPTKLEPLAPPVQEKPLKSTSEIGETYTSPLSEPLPLIGAILPAGSPLSIYHEMQILKHQLEQQCQQTQTAIGQVQLLKDQLAAESSSRLEAQAQNHQLMIHNKELLDHIHYLVRQVKQLELKILHLEGQETPKFPELPPIPEVSAVCNVTTPSPGPVNIPGFLQNQFNSMANSFYATTSSTNNSLVPVVSQNSVPTSWLSNSTSAANCFKNSHLFNDKTESYSGDASASYNDAQNGILYNSNQIKYGRSTLESQAALPINNVPDNIIKEGQISSPNSVIAVIPPPPSTQMAKGIAKLAQPNRSYISQPSSILSKREDKGSTSPSVSSVTSEPCGQNRNSFSFTPAKRVSGSYDTLFSQSKVFNSSNKETSLNPSAKEKGKLNIQEKTTKSPIKAYESRFLNS